MCSAWRLEYNTNVDINIPQPLPALSGVSEIPIGFRALLMKTNWNPWWILSAGERAAHRVRRQPLHGAAPRQGDAQVRSRRVS
jgi:hypothetical protein